MKLPQLVLWCALFLLTLTFGSAETLAAPAKPDAPKAPKTDTLVKLETSLGDIVIKLDTRKAPITTDNFLQYVKSGFYDGTIFHRVIRNFMIQGGGLTPNMKEKSTRVPIRNEGDNGLKNKKYTIAMARTSDPHSATAQFFINTQDNAFLDFKKQTSQEWGYAVFGHVVEGKNVVNQIERVATTKRGYYEDVPEVPIIIKKAVVIE